MWIVARIIPRRWHNRSNKRILWKVTSLVMNTFMSWWCFYALAPIGWLLRSLIAPSLLYLAKSSLKLDLAFFLGLEHLGPFWRHRSDRPKAPVKPVRTPVRPVLAPVSRSMQYWSIWSCLAPQALKSLKPWGSPPEVSCRHVFAFQWSHSFL
jgi:hypothetical protein